MTASLDETLQYSLSQVMQTKIFPLGAVYELPVRQPPSSRQKSINVGMQ